MADTTAPTAPGTPTATNVSGSNWTLSWTASSDNVGVTAYDIYRDGSLLTTNTGPIDGIWTSAAYTPNANVVHWDGSSFILLPYTPAGLTSKSTTDYGVSYTTNNMPVSSNWLRAATGVVGGQTITIAVATTGAPVHTIARSVNGGAWTTVPSPFPTNTNIQAVVFGASPTGSGVPTFVIIGTTGLAAYSQNGGVSFTRGDMPVLSSFYSVLTYGNGIFLATQVSSQTGYHTSTDGITWTTHNWPIAAPVPAVCFGAGNFVAHHSGTTRVYSSTDAVNWTLNNLASTASTNQMLYARGKYYIFPQAAANPVWYSSDLTTWHSMSLNNANLGFTTRQTMAVDNTDTLVNAGGTSIYMDSGVTAPDTTYTVTGQIANDSHSYYIIARDAAGNSSSQSGTLVYPPAAPAAPATPSLSQPTGTNRNVVVSWGASSGATSYTIYRGTSSGSLAQVGTSASTSYTDSSITTDNTYYYAVSATGSGGTSGQSTVVSITVDRAFTGMSKL